MAARSFIPPSPFIVHVGIMPAAHDDSTAPVRFCPCDPLCPQLQSTQWRVLRSLHDRAVADFIRQQQQSDPTYCAQPTSVYLPDGDEVTQVLQFVRRQTETPQGQQPGQTIQQPQGQQPIDSQQQQQPQQPYDQPPQQQQSQRELSPQEIEALCEGYRQQKLRQTQMQPQPQSQSQSQLQQPSLGYSPVTATSTVPAAPDSEGADLAGSGVRWSRPSRLQQQRLSAAGVAAGPVAPHAQSDFDTAQSQWQQQQDQQDQQYQPYQPQQPQSAQPAPDQPYQPQSPQAAQPGSPPQPSPILRVREFHISLFQQRLMLAQCARNIIPGALTVADLPMQLVAPTLLVDPLFVNRGGAVTGAAQTQTQTQTQQQPPQQQTVQPMQPQPVQPQQQQQAQPAQPVQPQPQPQQQQSAQPAQPVVLQPVQPVVLQPTTAPTRAQFAAMQADFQSPAQQQYQQVRRGKRGPDEGSRIAGREQLGEAGGLIAPILYCTQKPASHS